MARPGPGEGMAADEDLGQAEFAAEHPHLVLEQFAQRLDQLHVHALGQAADIVVRLDRDGGAAGERHALDHVGIERALREEVRAADLLRFRSNTSMNRRPMILRFCFGVGDAGELAEEQLRGVDMDQRDVVVVAEQVDHGLALRPWRSRP